MWGLDSVRGLAGARKAAALAAASIAALAAAPSSASAAGDSNSCTSPTATIADGFAGDTYVKLRAQESGGSTLVCFRLDNGASLTAGGLVTIADPSSAVAATPDDNGDACRTVGGDGTRVLAGTIGGTVPYEVAQYKAGDEQWVCVTAGSFKKRLRVRLADPQAVVNVDLDGAGVTTPVPRQPDSTLPSSACHYGTGGSKKELANIDVAGTDLLIGAWQPTTSKLSICLRAGGPVSGGGRLDIDASNLPSIDEVVASDHDADTSVCTQPLIESDAPVVFRLSVSTGTSLPAWICIEEQGVTTRYKVKNTSGIGKPTVNFVPDAAGPEQAAEQAVQDALAQVGPTGDSVADAVDSQVQTVEATANGVVSDAQSRVADTQATVQEAAAQAPDTAMDAIYGSATRASVSGSEVVVEAEDGVANTISIGYSANRWIITDQAGVLPASAECLPAGPSAVSCDGAVPTVYVTTKDGNDTIQVLNTVPASKSTRLDLGDGTDSAYGGSSTDDIFANGGAADVLSGGDNNDSLHADSNGSVVDGGAGDDYELAVASNVYLSGGDGNDSEDTWAGTNQLDGGNGDDNLEAMSIYGDETSSLLGGAGNDRLALTSWASVSAGGTMDGGTGSDQFHTSAPSSGPVDPSRVSTILSRDATVDTVICSAVTEHVTADASDQLNQAQGACDVVNTA